MKVHYFQHVPFEGLGVIEAWLQRQGHGINVTRLYRDDSLPAIEEVDWLIVLGGPMGVADEAKQPWLTAEKRFLTRFLETGKPVVGICLGAQLLADVLGARVERNPHKEIGWFPVQFTAAGRAHPLFQFAPPKATVFHWHGDTFALPAGAVQVARSEACEQQAFVWRDHVVALQFHLESTPAAVAALLQECGADLTPGQYVQSASAIRGNQVPFAAANALMGELLTRIESA